MLQETTFQVLKLNTNASFTYGDGQWGVVLQDYDGKVACHGRVIHRRTGHTELEALYNGVKMFVHLGVQTFIAATDSKAVLYYLKMDTITWKI